MCFVDDLLALPQTLRVGKAQVVPQRPVVVGERGQELGDFRRLGAALQHGAHHGGHVYIPAVITHRPPAAVTVDFHFARAAVQTSSQSDCSHLYTRKRQTVRALEENAYDTVCCRLMLSKLFPIVASWYHH